MSSRTAGPVVLLAALTMAGCDGKAEGDLPPPVRPALTMLVQPAARGTSRSFTGTVEPRYQAQLAFQTVGRMTSRDVNVGDLVSKGQLLATLDTTVARLTLVSARADLANSQAALVNAQATNRRQQELIRTGAVSQAQVDAAVAARDTAQAKVNQAQASLQKAQDQFGYTALKSGYDGVVASWNAEVGQIVAMGQTVVTIARPDARDAVFDVSDDIVGRFGPGTDFAVSLLADPSLTARATSREVAPQADAATRTRRVRLTLNDAGEAFRLGTIVTLAVDEPASRTIEIPATSVLEQNGTASVWLVGAEGKLGRRPVSLGPAHDGTVTVLSGLSAGDRLLTAGVHSVSDGETVKILEN